jgi:hypothetical protein
MKCCVSALTLVTIIVALGHPFVDVVHGGASLNNVVPCDTIDLATNAHIRRSGGSGINNCMIIGQADNAKTIPGEHVANRKLAAVAIGRPAAAADRHSATVSVMNKNRALLHDESSLTRAAISQPKSAAASNEIYVNASPLTTDETRDDESNPDADPALVSICPLHPLFAAFNNGAHVGKTQIYATISHPNAAQLLHQKLKDLTNPCTTVPDTLKHTAEFCHQCAAPLQHALYHAYQEHFGVVPKAYLQLDRHEDTNDATVSNSHNLDSISSDASSSAAEQNTVNAVVKKTNNRHLSDPGGISMENWHSQSTLERMAESCGEMVLDYLEALGVPIDDFFLASSTFCDGETPKHGATQPKATMLAKIRGNGHLTN